MDRVKRTVILRGRHKESANHVIVDGKDAANVVMESAATHEITSAAVPPARRTIKMEAINCTALIDDVIQHRVYFTRLVKLAITFIEKVLRREAAGDQLQTADAIEQIEAHPDRADERIRVSE